jgi:hypothetical protein
MKKKKATYKEMMNYLDQVALRIENNQKAVYDLSQVLTDYIEMRGKSVKLNDFMQNKHLGSDAGIPTRWSVFVKVIKDKYLKMKKILAFKK